MKQERYTFFSFLWGGFFMNSHGFRIERIGNDYVATEYEMLADEPEREFKVNEGEVEELRRTLCELGVDEWLSRYNNSNVLDGTQWECQHLFGQILKR